MQFFPPKAPAKGYFQQATDKIHSHTSPTSSSHHLTYIIIIYINITYINITYINIIYLIMYITYITYIIYIIYIFYNIIIYIIVYINIIYTIYTIYIIIYTYIIYINIMYIICQELIRRRKTPIDSGVNTQEKNSYQEPLLKTPTKHISSSINSLFGGRAVQVGSANRNPFARNEVRCPKAEVIAIFR